MIRRGPRRPQAKTPDDVMSLTDHLAELRVAVGAGEVRGA